MSSASETSRKAAYLFLILCCVAVIGYGGYYLYLNMAPAKVAVPEVPYGLKAGTEILVGDAPNFRQELATLPIQTQGEFRRATELSRNGAVAQANEIFNAVSLLYPDLILALWSEANTLFEMDSLTDLEKNRLNLIVGKLQGKFPNSGLSSYLESRKIYKENKTVSMEMAKLAVDKAPALFEARLWYARLLRENNRMAQATEEARTAISLSAGDAPQAFDLLANLFHDQGELDSCSSLLDYGLSQFPMDGELMLLRGYLLEYQGRYDEAEKTYQRLLALRPDFDKASAALATVGEKTAPGVGGVKISPMDRMQLAWEILEPLVEKYPENMPLREALGLAYLKGRDYDRARSQFSEIQNRDPEYPDIAQRIQECNVVRPSLPRQAAGGLAADLNRAVDSLRESMAPSSTHDFSTMLGHYLVRYGATPAEFFKKYAVTNFRPVRKNAWQESFYEAPYKHTYTVVFDSLNRFREVHVTVYDSSTASNHLGLAPEIFTRLLKQNSRISGIGNNTGETDCGEGLVIDAAVWETQDNFEILARIVGKPTEVKMVRFDKTVLPPGIKLCDYVGYLNEF